MVFCFEHFSSIIANNQLKTLTFIWVLAFQINIKDGKFWIDSSNINLENKDLHEKLSIDSSTHIHSFIQSDSFIPSDMILTIIWENYSQKQASHEG